MPPTTTTIPSGEFAIVRSSRGNGQGGPVQTYVIRYKDTGIELQVQRRAEWSTPLEADPEALLLLAKTETMEITKL